MRGVFKRTFCGVLSMMLMLGGTMPAVAAKEQPKAEKNLAVNERQVLDFNTDWIYVEGDDLDAKNPQYDESGAQSVSLPHAREAYDLFEPNIGNVQSQNWYRRHFTLPEEDAKDRVFVEFNGGGQVNKVYVNGAFVGEAKGTFTHFKFDITDYVSFGEYDNVIAVQVDSRYHKDDLPPGNSIDFHYFGGLHGQAKMIITDNLHAESVFYYNDDVEKGCKTATLNGWIDVTNRYDSDYQVTINSIVRDKEGNVVSTVKTQEDITGKETEKVKLTHEISEPQLWSPKNPYLYTVETQILSKGNCVDSQTTTIGIRTFRASKVTDKKGQFYLNGEPIEVVGGNWHMQAPYLGNSKTEKLNAKDAEILKHDLGINFVRTSHYEADPSFLDACDRLGIMVEEEPLGWNDTPGWEQFCYSMDAMVQRDRNHASIVLWSIVPNERQKDYPSVEEGKKRYASAKSLDPSRLTIQEEMNNSAVIADVYGWHDYTNPNGNTIHNNPNASSWFVTEWNTNLGKHFVIPGDSETRKNAQIVQDGKKLGQLQSDARVMGTLKWDLFGYYTPQTAYERGKNVDLWRSSGVYGIWRNPIHKTWMADLLACQSPNAEAVGDVIKIASEWKSDSVDTIRVITNVDEVELYYDNGNGNLKLVKRMEQANEYADTLKKGMFCFDKMNLKWTKDSKLVARGYKKGEQDAVAEDIVYASTYDCEKKGASLQMHNTIGNIEADGSDAAWILAELKDKNGQREFYGDEVVQAKIVSGPGKLIYARNNPIMVDGISGFYLKSEKDQTGTTEIQTEVDLGVNVDDNSTEIIYSGSGWKQLEDRQDAYQGTLHETSVSGDSVTIKFTGTQIDVYSESSDKNGEAVVTLDGKKVGKLSCNNIAKYNTISNQRVYRSGQLEDGTHTLTITASGGKINLDRIKVFDGIMDVRGVVEVKTDPSSAKRVQSRPDLPDAELPVINSVETLELLLEESKNIKTSNYTISSVMALKDAIMFGECVLELKEPSEEIIYKAVQQLQNAIGNLKKQPISMITHEMRVMEGQSGGVAYVSDNDNVWTTGTNNTYANKSRTANDYYTISFTGVMIELFSTFDSAHGIAAVSIDGGVETEINQYRANQEKDVLFWKSDLLQYGSHTVKVRVTGKTGGNPNNACVSFGRAKIYESINELEEAKITLANKVEEATRIERTKFTKESLETFDDALFYAQELLKEIDVTAERVNEALVQLAKAMEGLQISGAGNYVITCLDKDKASKEGELNKVYYSSKKAEDWVLENAENEDLRNKYLKKTATGQTEAYASVVMEGTQVELFARFSSTSGLAEVELYDAENNKLDSKVIDLYDASVGAKDTATRQAYQSPQLERGTYTLKIIPKNEASPDNLNKNMTSINLAKVVVTNAEEDESVDTTKLEQTLTELNKVSLDKKHMHTIQSFYVNVQCLLKHSYELLTGEWPQIQLVQNLPDGTTDARLDKVAEMVNDILYKLNTPLTVQEVGKLKGITVLQGTPDSKIPFPTQVIVVSSEGQREKVGISEWVCADYLENTPGAYVFEGILLMPEGMENPEEKKASVQVIVEKVENPDEPNPDKPNPDEPNPDKPNPDEPDVDEPNPDEPNTDNQNPDNQNSNNPNQGNQNLGNPEPDDSQQESFEVIPETGDAVGNIAIAGCVWGIMIVVAVAGRKRREK